jgi:hypothetical protein
MENVLLQINLVVWSVDGMRIRRLKPLGVASWCLFQDSSQFGTQQSTTGWSTSATATTTTTSTGHE